jgi:phosphate transport system substrate-binding protein
VKYSVNRITIALFILSCIAVFAPVLHVEGQLAGELVIEGTGDSQALLREIAELFEERYPETTIQVPDSIGSSGGIKAVGTGKAELGRVARPLKEKERAYGLTYAVFAVSPVVLVVHPSVEGVDNLTAEQIVGIYSGTLTDWQQLGGAAHKLYPIGRETGDSSRIILEAHVPGFQEIQKPVAKVYYTTPETLQGIVDHEYTIGYVPMAMIHNSGLHTIGIDGIAPSIENIRQNRYKMVAPLGIVYKKPLNPLAKAFADFLSTPDVHEIIEEYGCLPVGETLMDPSN